MARESYNSILLERILFLLGVLECLPTCPLFIAHLPVFLLRLLLCRTGREYEFGELWERISTFVKTMEFPLSIINSWGSSSNGRALASHARCSGIDTRLLQINFCFFFGDLAMIFNIVISSKSICADAKQESKQVTHALSFCYSLPHWAIALPPCAMLSAFLFYGRLYSLCPLMSFL